MIPKIKAGAVIAASGGKASDFHQRGARHTDENPQLPFDPLYVEGAKRYTTNNAFQYALMMDAIEDGGVTTKTAITMVNRVDQTLIHPLNYPDHLPDIWIGMTRIENRPKDGRDPYFHPIFATGPMDQIETQMQRKLIADEKEYSGSHSVVRIFMINASRAAKRVRKNGANLSIAAFEENPDLIYMLHANYNWPDWLPEDQRDWSTVHLIDPR